MSKNSQDDRVLYEVESGVGMTKKIRKKTIAVDFDRTICVRTGGQSIFKLGQPILPMVNKVKGWIKEGKKVIIFTARHPKQYPLLQEWLTKNGLPDLEITNVKSPNMDEFWDDKAIGVIENAGIEADGGTCDYVETLIYNNIFNQTERENFCALEDLCREAVNYPTSVQKTILGATRAIKLKISTRKDLFEEYKFRNRIENDSVWKGLE